MSLAAAEAAAVSYDSVDAIPDSAVDALLDSLRPRFSAAGQSHVFAFVAQLSLSERRQLAFDLHKLRVEHIERDYREVLRQEQAALSMSPEAASAADAITPFTNVTSLASTPAATVAEWRASGLSLLSQGQVAVVLMAGGQGTRLGSDRPKGCFDIGLLSGRSLFALHALRLLRLRQLASEHAGVAIESVRIPWVVMTSIATHGATVAFFEQERFFGLDRKDVSFFMQSELAALSAEGGKILLSTPSSVALSPNGNGGLFEGLAGSGVLARLESQSVRFAHVIGVDNALALGGDPVFIGAMVASKADVGNKVVLKQDPLERVGVFCLRGGRPSVVEYSELPQAMAQLRGADGRLLYSAANIVQHFFTIDFLKQNAENALSYHVARKSIPSVSPASAGGSGPVPTVAVAGLKLELFIFDAFARSVNMHCLAIERADEFAPVKNAAGTDSPATARQYMSDLHCRMLQQAGATLLPSAAPAAAAADGVCECEISPLVSYAGEGLRELVGGKALQLPLLLNPDTVLPNNS